MTFGHWGLCWALRSCKGSCEVLWHPDGAGWEQLQFKMHCWCCGGLCLACVFSWGGWGWLNLDLAFSFWIYDLFPSPCDMDWWNFIPYRWGIQLLRASAASEAWDWNHFGIGIWSNYATGCGLHHHVFVSWFTNTWLWPSFVSLGCLRFMNTCVRFAHAQTSVHLCFIYSWLMWLFHGDFIYSFAHALLAWFMVYTSTRVNSLYAYEYW